MIDVTALLKASLPELDQRLRAPEIEALAARARTVAELCAVLDGTDAQIRTLEDDLAATTDDRASISAWLRKHAPPGSLGGDLRSVRRSLDLAVVRERTARQVDNLGVTEELAVTALAATGDASGLPRVVARLRTARRWQTRRAAALGLVPHANQLGEDDVARVQAVTTDPGESVWVRSAADALFLAARPHEAPAHLRAGLQVTASPRGFLLRRRRVGMALNLLRPDDASAILTPVLSDPSEHVRLGLVADLAARAQPALIEALAWLLRNDPSAKVRAAALRFAAGAPQAGLSALAIEALRTDASPAVRVQAAGALVAVAGSQPDVVPAALTALEAALGDPNASPTLLEACSAALGRIRITAHPDQRALRDRLQERLREVPEGGRVRLTWSDLGASSRPDDADVGALLADLAARDFGLWGSTDARGVTIRRGDRERVRAWRVLHELFHPAPAKRSDRSHVTGRDVRAPLRAPPGRMAEVTATTVPGERVGVDRLGGWGGYLPTVDDLLDLPAGQTARIYTAAGETTLTAPRSWLSAALAKTRLTWSYASWAAGRQRALAAVEGDERAAWLTDVHRRLGYEVRLPEAAPAHVSSLSPTLALAPALLEPLRRGLSSIGTYLASPSSTSQAALAVLAAGGAALLLGEGFWRRREIRHDRESIALSIGGWGTRGKSGTERLKAGLFHGLGHATFVKTTGCEAMFIPAWPGLPAREIFVHRPYDKATIWEQARMLRLAARMKSRVFLWECMALRPRYVEVLEQRWMQDDLCTITNAFPDHEDIQGPAGVDVARAISSFMPVGSVAVTTEREFLPIFTQRARERGTTLHAVEAEEADAFGDDLLALFPYQEHPRNIALVARAATLLGVEPDLAITMMADHVVPDLGVLRVYPPARVLSRALVFINGMSANERTGTVNNWRRTGLDAIGLSPTHAVATVVNNRADRVARSEVFARILVQDLVADRHVLIGTNLRGLLGYIDAALAAELSGVTLRRLDDDGDTPATRRLGAWMARLRIATPTLGSFRERARAWAQGAGADWVEAPRLSERVQAWLSAASQQPLALTEVRAQLQADAALVTALDASWHPGAPQADELLGPPPDDAFLDHALQLLARLVVHARLQADVRAGGPDLDRRFAAAWADLFRASLVVLDDPGLRGDAIIAQVARCLPPGTDARVMGVQNIKGTGLDFAYRWLAHGTVSTGIDRVFASSGPARAAALRDLQLFDDRGLVDSANLAVRLGAPLPDETPEETALRTAIVTQARAIADARRAGIGSVQRRGILASLLDYVEDMVDWVDGVFRARRAGIIANDVADHRISLGAAAQRMSELTTRQRGGWLARALLG